MVMELAPKKPPSTAAAESTMRMGWISSMLPSLSTKSARSATPITVPIVSKKSLMRSEKTNMSKAGVVTTCRMATVLDCGSIWKGAANAEKSKPKFMVVGITVTPRGMPTMVAATMEISSVPFTFRVSSTTASAIATNATMH